MHRRHHENTWRAICSTAWARFPHHGLRKKPFALILCSRMIHLLNLRPSGCAIVVWALSWNFPCWQSNETCCLICRLAGPCFRQGPTGPQKNRHDFGREATHKLRADGFGDRLVPGPLGEYHVGLSESSCYARTLGRRTLNWGPLITFPRTDGLVIVLRDANLQATTFGGKGFFLWRSGGRGKLKE